MTVTEEVKETGKKLVERIGKFDVPTDLYSRGPNGPAVFTVSISGGELKVWPGTADIDIRGSKKHRQVVLNVEERRRTVTHTVKVASSLTALGLSSRKDLRLTRRVEDDLRRGFPVRFPRPDDVTWTFSGLKDVTTEEQIKNRANQLTFEAKVTATVKASRQSFLAGYDESDLFISMLPKKVSSIKEAHDALRPKGVDHRAVRQGEWFFQPVDSKLSEKLDQIVKKRPNSLSRKRLGGSWDATHQADQITYNNRTYAIGFVTDSNPNAPTGRSRHHEPLWLGDWHQVIRNRELQQSALPGSSPTQRRSWD